jgi:hypothetical protein
MPRVLVGLMVAAGTVMSALVGYAHGDLVWVIIVEAGAVTGLAAYATAPAARTIAQKNSHCDVILVTKLHVALLGL